MSLRVLIVDDHAVVRLGFRALIATLDDIEVVGEAADGADAVARAHELAPDVVLMDIQMPVLDGIEATRRIVAHRPATAVLVLTMFEEEDTIRAALAAGARGYLLKGAQQDDVARALAAVGSGHLVLGPGVAERVLPALARPAPGAPAPPFPELTEREREVLALVGEGRNNQDIGRRLHLSPKTVANHVSNVLVKLHLEDRSAAIVAARRAGLGER